MLLFLYNVFYFQNIVQAEDKKVEEKETSNTEVALSEDEDELEIEIGKFLSFTSIAVAYFQINQVEIRLEYINTFDAKNVQTKQLFS